MSVVAKKRQSEVSVSSSDSEDDRPKKIVAVPTNFKVRKATVNQGLFTIDATPFEVDLTGDDAVHGPENVNSLVNDVVVDKQLEKILSKAKCGPAFEKNPGETAKLLGTKALKRLRREEKEKTAGKEWFNLPATEMTDEVRADLELIQMRAAIDPTRHYKKSDRDVLPKYFQVGRVVDAPEDYYSSRMTKKERKKTMVDELLNDMEFLERSKSKYKELQAAASRKKHGAFQRRPGPYRKKKDNTEKKKRH